MPAEWEPQSCLWLAWPHCRDTWPGRFDAIPAVFVRWIRAVADAMPVQVLASGSVADHCRATFGKTGLPHNMRLVDVPTDDCWIRDYGPTFVHDRDSEQLIGVNWRYNAWGGKYPPWDRDDAAARLICAAADIACVDGDLCLEGGAIEVDGHGRMLTTQCLLSESRNPGVEKQTIAQRLHRQLGVTEIVWLETDGLQGDDTDGHIDQLARFIDRRNVVVAVSSEADDPNRLPLEKAYRQLDLWADSTEPRVTVHRLPTPPPRQINGQRVPESYCNFLRLGPERILVPTFGAPTDDHAVAILGELSGADVTKIDCRELVWGLGALHCASRDMPA